MHKNFIITLNNPDVTPKQFCERVQQNGFTYARAQLERGADTGTLHLQGVFGGRRIRFDAAKKIFPRAHVEVAKHPRAAWRYCGKEATREGQTVEYGKPPFLSNSKQDQAERNAEIIEAGPEEAVKQGLIKLEHYPACRRACDLLKIKSHDLQSIDDLENEWHYGEPGIGKSRHVRQQWPSHFIKSANKWWDGYAGQETVVIDDFEVEHKCLGHHLKIWGDHYPFVGETKGGNILIRPKRIIITSNYLPVDIWTDRQMIKAIERRFKII